LKSVISYFTQNVSSVFISALALDISKAFDSVNHFKLYHLLLSAGIPVMIRPIDVLCDWYGKLFFFAVKWNIVISLVTVCRRQWCGKEVVYHQPFLMF